MFMLILPYNIVWSFFLTQVQNAPIDKVDLDDSKKDLKTKESNGV